jgi:exodeoxyribonuclease VII large subunit
VSSREGRSERLPGWDAVGSDPPRATAQAPGTFGLRILTVSEVTRAIRGVVAAEERLRDLWVEGEIGRVTISSAGHAYFALRDQRNQLQCVWFRDDRLRSPFEARTGLRVVAHGRMDLYEPIGALQLYVAEVQPAGYGDLSLRLEALKAKLAAEGVFDASRRRPLPELPRVVGVVTSPSGAVWHDIRTVLERRWPLVTVVLAPCNVQGDGAPESIVGALGRLARYGERCRLEGREDEAPAVTILARGGGSLEDLWSFNDERVVRAIAAHPVPLVCGVGHEVDTTLADLAADVRAPTPSAAAEVVVPDRSEVGLAIRARGRRLDQLVQARLAAANADVAAEGRVLERLDPRARLAMARERIGRSLDRATTTILARLDSARRAEGRMAERAIATLPVRLDLARTSLAEGSAALAVLGPQATLDRGYAIVRRRADERVVRAPADAPAGTGLDVRVGGGSFPATSGEPR